MTKQYLLRRETCVDRPVETVFEFFSRPENLPHITPAWLSFRILTPPPIPMWKGALIDYTIKVMGVRLRWQTIIREYEPPRGFIDEQRSGPYAFWRHTHSFSPVEGGTRITDEVRYRVPYGILGRIAHGLVVRRQLDTIFAYRAGAIKKFFAGTSPTVETPMRNPEQSAEEVHPHNHGA